jgi:hypothetical protein
LDGVSGERQLYQLAGNFSSASNAFSRHRCQAMYTENDKKHDRIIG